MRRYAYLLVVFLISVPAFSEAPIPKEQQTWRCEAVCSSSKTKVVGIAPTKDKAFGKLMSKCSAARGNLDPRITADSACQRDSTREEETTRPVQAQPTAIGAGTSAQ